MCDEERRTGCADGCPSSGEEADSRADLLEHSSMGGQNTDLLGGDPRVGKTEDPEGPAAFRRGPFVMRCRCGGPAHCRAKE